MPHKLPDGQKARTTSPCQHPHKPHKRLHPDYDGQYMPQGHCSSFWQPKTVPGAQPLQELKPHLQSYLLHAYHQEGMNLGVASAAFYSCPDGCLLPNKGESGWGVLPGSC